MHDWTEPKTITYGACTIIIHRPTLTDAERARRESAVQDTLALVMRDYIPRKDQSHAAS